MQRDHRRVRQLTAIQPGYIHVRSPAYRPLDVDLTSNSMAVTFKDGVILGTQPPNFHAANEQGH
jgi:hypothetical protein